MLIKIAGRVRGLFAGNYPENREDEQFHLNTRGDQIIAQGLPELAEIVRLGDSWEVMTATAIAALTAIPTTTGGLNLWNGESGGGRSYVIDSCGMVDVVVDATQANCSALFYMVSKPPVTAPTDAALTFRSMSGRTYGGRARTTVNAAVTNDGWFPIGTSAPVAAAAGGSAWKATDVPVRGLIIIPPQAGFSLHCAKVAATASQVQFFIRWHEVQLIVKS